MELKRFLGNFAKTFLAVGALSVSAFAGADDYHSQSCAPSCLPAACAPVSCSTGCCGQPCCEPPACGWGYNPPAYCRCNNPVDCCNSCDGFGVRFDFLWWRSCVTGVALGTEESQSSFAIPTADVSRTNRSRLKKPDFKFDPGFRIGVSNYCACDCWDMALVWTHYHTKAKAHGDSVASVDGSPAVTFISYWERGTGVNPDNAASRYSLNLDLLDLEFGRKYYVSSCFVLRPHFGLRGARINQDYKVFSEAFTSSSTPAVGADFISEVKSKNDFLAIGPRVGVEAQIHLGCGFSIVGEAAGSLVYGRFNRHSRERYTDFTTTAGATTDFLYDAKVPSDRCSRAFTDLAVGVKWERCFDWCGRQHPVGIEFTWEHHAFYNMSNFNFASRGLDIQLGAYSATGGAQKTGDIYTQGLTVAASFGF